jgi:glycosyltransferase involved in cell wall biosynthesis
MRKLRKLLDLYKLIRVEGRLQAMEWVVQNDVRALREQVDLLLCRQDVPPGLAEEFGLWKSRHPVPDRPLVSVCVATYNRARLLTERCLPSILRQTYRRLELIVVGDGCDDETETAVAHIDDPRLTFVNLPCRGAYPADPALRWMVAGTPAMNHAMSMARGDFVTHLDDDDEFLPERLEKLVAFAREHTCDFIWHPYWAQDGAGQWGLCEARELAYGHVTTSSVFYRSWLTRFQWELHAYRLREPGDWNRFRRIKHIQPVCMRYPEPLLRHYRERAQSR